MQGTVIRMEGLVKLVYNDGRQGDRSIVGYIIDEDEHFRTIRRQSDGRRFEIGKRSIIKTIELEEE